MVVELDDSLNIAEDVHCCLGTWLRHGRQGAETAKDFVLTFICI